MNIALKTEIIKHIFANLAIIPSNFVNLDNTKSIMNSEFKLKETLSFEDSENDNNVWGCKMLADKQEIKILIANCTIDNNKEYSLIFQLKDTPIYGLYYIDSDPEKSVIACSLDGEKWMQCSTFLQATFLAGMENIKNIGLSYSKCNDYKSQFKAMNSFIKYFNLVYEAEYEG